MATQKKIDTVKKLSEKIARAKSIVFVEYGTAKHKQLETLRKNLQKVDAEFTVTKNKLMERALGNTAESVKENLKSSTAILFTYKDEVAGLKEFLKFVKLAATGKTKGGLLGTRVMTTADITKLSTLPGRQELLGKLAGQMKAPLFGLHHALQWNINKLVWGMNAIRNKKV